MALDENRPSWESRRLRQDYPRNDYSLDEGSSEAEEAIQARYLAKHHARRRAPGLIQDERVPTLHAELVDDGMVAAKDWQVPS